ncbi:hypothetical protein ACNKHM_17700 [Shigella sonnei]
MLRRLTLGRSWWDLNIEVDVEKYRERNRQKAEGYENDQPVLDPTNGLRVTCSLPGLWAPA